MAVAVAASSKLVTAGSAAAAAAPNQPAATVERAVVAAAADFPVAAPEEAWGDPLSVARAHPVAGRTPAAVAAERRLDQRFSSIRVR